MISYVLSLWLTSWLVVFLSVFLSVYLLASFSSSTSFNSPFHSLLLILLLSLLLHFLRLSLLLPAATLHNCHHLHVFNLLRIMDPQGGYLLLPTPHHTSYTIISLFFFCRISYIFNSCKLIPFQIVSFYYSYFIIS